MERVNDVPQPNMGRSSCWADFPTFVCNSRGNLLDEFNRLANETNWSKKECAEERAKCYAAEFHFHFVKGKTKLEMWQDFCDEVEMVKIPKSTAKCKKALNGVLVNLINLIDRCRDPDVKLVKFASYTQFCRYTQKNLFPKQSAKSSLFLKTLLRVVF
ncbi:hypothetical protein B0J11DRAFT_180242 [Dendryphion nanum]|uniref:Uncharacterized protein n=1 Tax=Dendryphion nanum TaxID=256645 RepID=A0A9P9D570_9PLEO|nr:hypothetical protein B0J11DRAFT_180242 [Dendryphion nanum]